MENTYSVKIYDDYFSFSSKKEAITFVNNQSGKYCELLENGVIIDYAYPL